MVKASKQTLRLSSNLNLKPDLKVLPLSNSKKATVGKQKIRKAVTAGGSKFLRNRVKNPIYNNNDCNSKKVESDDKDINEFLNNISFVLKQPERPLISSLKSNLTNDFLIPLNNNKTNGLLLLSPKNNLKKTPIAEPPSQSPDIIRRTSTDEKVPCTKKVKSPAIRPKKALRSSPRIATLIEAVNSEETSTDVQQVKNLIAEPKSPLKPTNQNGKVSFPVRKSPRKSATKKSPKVNKQMPTLINDADSKEKERELKSKFIFGWNSLIGKGALGKTSSPKKSSLKSRLNFSLDETANTNERLLNPVAKILNNCIDNVPLASLIKSAKEGVTKKLELQKKFFPHICDPVNSKSLFIDVNRIDSEVKLEENEDKARLQKEIDNLNAKLQSTLTENDIRSATAVYELCEIAWATLGRHPYWPCIILNDPTKNIFKRPLRNAVSYHVHFFGDNGRRAWIRNMSLLKYTSKFDLEAILTKFQDKLTTSVQKTFNVSERILPKWQIAVDEAQALRIFPTDKRAAKFFEQLEFDRKTQSASKIKVKKLKNEVQETPKVTKAKENEKKRGRRSSIVDSEHVMSLRKRIKVETEVNITPEIKIKAENEENDARRKKAQLQKKMDLMPTLESQNALYKRNNLFPSELKERVCNACFKPKNIFKCQGICNGFFHQRCVQDESDVKSTSTIISIQEQIDLRMKEAMKPVSELTIYPDSDSDVEILVPPNFQDIISVCSTVGSFTEIKCEPPPNFKCEKCRLDQLPNCVVCHNEVSKRGQEMRFKCRVSKCGRYYHRECLRLWPQAQWSTKHGGGEGELAVCPMHVCHTCVSDDPRQPAAKCSPEKVVRCMKCPATYHSRAFCVPAGTEILSQWQIVCPRHGTEPKRPVNTSWCFMCSDGGTLVCCETCPTSVHSACLPVNLNDDNMFICEDCESGRMPMYDDIVWVKLGGCKWWPGLILFPGDVPDNIWTMNHLGGDFVVKFFGTYDHSWVGRHRAFLFQDDDTVPSCKDSSKASFGRAIVEAGSAYKIKQQFKRKQLEKFKTKPPPYVRIKFNRRVGNVKQFEANCSTTNACNCNPYVETPCGMDSECLNRMLFVECNPETCPAGARCNNQCFEKAVYPALTPFQTKGKGWGLRTDEPLSRGQFVIEYVGELIDMDEYNRRVRNMHENRVENYYFLTVDHKRMLDAGPKGNVARFMNHSCMPNCETQKWTVNGCLRIGLFATEDIPTNTEVTFNYNLECIGEQKKVCGCGAPNCTGFIGVKSKNEKPEKKRAVSTASKKKTTPANNNKLVIVEDCFICDKVALDAVACNHKDCKKFYHLECLKLTNAELGSKLICSRHICNECGIKTGRCCVKCLNSYCRQHWQGFIHYDKQLKGFICHAHETSTQTVDHTKSRKSSKKRSQKNQVPDIINTAEFDEVPLSQLFKLK